MTQSVEYPQETPISSIMSSLDNFDSIRKGDIYKLLSSCMAKADDADEKRAQAILDVFEVQPMRWAIRCPKSVEARTMSALLSMFKRESECIKFPLDVHVISKSTHP